MGLERFPPAEGRFSTGTGPFSLSPANMPQGDEADSRPQVYLLWGGTGWIGGILKTLLEEGGKKVVVASSRIENRQDVERELDEHKPSRVIMAAGLTGRYTLNPEP
ncbi:hypothetical protein T484DRAFT_1787952 [Baffinella frigidus]|nr:hypothetical protein T484DRAFT_1787952 [Cryptophyta sp. CCMP2293]